MLGNSEGRDQEDSRTGQGPGLEGFECSGLGGAMQVLFLCYQGSGMDFQLRKMALVASR